jgi:hypothetical protein
MCLKTALKVKLSAVLLAYVGKNVTSMAPPASGPLLEITAEKCSPYFSPLTLFYEKIGFAFLCHLHPHYYEQAPIVG